ncbi:MAG: Cellulase (glycosyl hydrolase family 5), partial [Acidimicrobiales bacterium]|nr:Cellulase (glycosyl hydrolase family 5) [Acidimicrobiales bacterium]
DPSTLLNRWITVSAASPVMVTEFGWPDRSDGTYNRNVIGFAEARGWGWSGFAWSNWQGGLFSVLADVGPSYEPSPAGMPVLAGLARN